MNARAKFRRNEKAGFQPAFCMREVVEQIADQSDR
jgi:hypothetical protein